MYTIYNLLNPAHPPFFVSVSVSVPSVTAGAAACWVKGICKCSAPRLSLKHVSVRRVKKARLRPAQDREKRHSKKAGRKCYQKHSDHQWQLLWQFYLWRLHVGNECEALSHNVFNDLFQPPFEEINENKWLYKQLFHEIPFDKIK